LDDAVKILDTLDYSNQRTKILTLEKRTKVNGNLKNLQFKLKNLIKI
jgi:hypothetical protein